MCSGKSPVYAALDQFFHAYLVERDLEKTLSLVTEDLYSLGTGAEELAVGRDAFEALLRAEFAMLPGPIHYKIREYREKERAPGIWDCICQVTTTLALAGAQAVEYETRLTGSFQKQEGKYLASVLHMSEASHNQGHNEFFPLRYVSPIAQRLYEPTQHELISLLGQTVPGGIIGAYLEEGFPFYAVNDTLLEMLGYEYEEFWSDTSGLVRNAIHPDDQNRVDEAVNQALCGNQQYELEYRMRKKDGSYLWVYDMGRNLTTPEGRPVTICLVMDTTERIRKQEHLRREARLDPLTGLYNRRGGQEWIEKALAAGGSWMFFLLDIDFFKQVNDLYGHHEGDHLLRFLARSLQSSFRDTDILVRLGGDEFGVFLAACEEDLEVIRRKLEEVGLQYQAEVQAHYPLSASTLSFGGIYGKGSASFSLLYREADRVLYSSKQAGRGRYQIQTLDREAIGLSGRTCLPDTEER